MVKDTLKSFERENTFPTYLTRGTLLAEERGRKFHNHGKEPSYQTFADASMRKVVPKSCGSHFEGIDEKALLRFETGTKCHDHPREIVGPSWQNWINDMTDGVIYEGKLNLCLILVTFV